MVVDDEPLARSNVRVLLQRDPDIEVVGECQSGAEALREIPSRKPELLFLDVQMPELDGFDVLEQLGFASPPGIIFVTAYDSYALRAFEAGALDYLLKPFDNLRFERALARAKERIWHASTGSGVTKRIVVKSLGQVIFIRPEEIDWIEAADYYVSLHVGQKTHLLRRSLAEMEQELDPRTFSRIHRSAIVNLGRVKALDMNRQGDYEVVIADGIRLRLSRSYRKQVQQRLGISDRS